VKVDICDSYSPECDQFVQQIPTAKLCYLSAWNEMVKRTFGHKSLYLVAREGGTVCGVLPLIHVRSRLFGDRLISQAFSNYGGPLTKNPAASDALCKRAVELATENGCESLELRNIDPIPYDFYLRTDKISMYLPLTSDPIELWRSLRPQIRNRVRKAEKSGIATVCGGPELLDDFYRVWTIRMHQLGTPCYSRKLFSSIMETFPDCCQIFLVHLNNTTVGALFVYCFNGLVQVRWGAALAKYNHLAPFSLLFWSVAKHYCEAKAKCLDFGTSTACSSQYEFKKRWGAKPIQLHYQYWIRSACELSLISPDNAEYINKIRMWKKLPLWMTRLIGPHISHSLP